MTIQKQKIKAKTGTVKVNDINIYYEIRGDGFPIMMILGLSENVDWFSADFLNKISKNFKAITFDNRGAGRSDKSDIEYSIKMFAKDTVNLMDALDIEKAHVFGHSMGGMIAQELVLNYPKRVEKLVLCSTFCGGSKTILPKPEIMATLMNGTEGMTLEEAADLIIILIYTEEFIKNNPDIIKRSRKNILKAPTPEFSYQRQLSASMKFNAARKLKKVKTPTLIIHGTEDVLFPVQNAEILANLIPGAKTILLEKTANEIFYSSTERLNKALIEFLK